MTKSTTFLFIVYLYLIIFTILLGEHKTPILLPLSSDTAINPVIYKNMF